MKVILSGDVANLGSKGDVVEVKDGYARNYLLPKRLAFAATKGALKQAEAMQRARAEQERKAKEAAGALVNKLAASPVYISARAGEGGRLFGSVTNSDIARAIKEQLEQEIDRHDIRLDDPIRTIGTHQVEVHLHPEVNALVTVEVIEHEEDEG